MLSPGSAYYCSILLCMKCDLFYSGTSLEKHDSIPVRTHLESARVLICPGCTEPDLSWVHVKEVLLLQASHPLPKKDYFSVCILEVY